MSAPEHIRIPWETDEPFWQGGDYQGNGDLPLELPTPAGEPDSWTPISLADLEDKLPLQPVLGGLGIVYPGKRHVFSGPQESAKTLAAYAVGISVVRAGGVVIVIDFEMGPWDARDRLRELGATQDEIASPPWHYIEPAEPAVPATAERLLALRPTLVIVDAAAGAYDLQGLDDNKRADVERFTRLYVRTFWQAAVATIVLDHVVKNVEGRANYAIGSERKVGGTDVHLGFEVVTPIKRGSHGLYKIVTHKDRGGWLKRGKLADLELRSDAETHQITWEFKPADQIEEGKTFRPTHLMEKVSRWLEAQHEPQGRNAITEACKGKRAIDIRTAITCLLDEGYAAEHEGPNRSKLCHMTRPFREEQDALERVLPGTSAYVPDAPVPSTSGYVPPLQGDAPGGTYPKTHPVRPDDDGNDDIPF